jgi:death-on-curing protein
MTGCEPRWIDRRLALTIHARQLVEHGGTAGVRDAEGLDAALARPRQLHAYGEHIDCPALAAAYAVGIARRHPFVDGNKRVSYVLGRTFLLINGWDLVGPLVERYPVFLGVAAGEVDEDALVEWLRAHARPQAVNESRARYE